MRVLFVSVEEITETNLCFLYVQSPVYLYQFSGQTTFPINYTIQYSDEWNIIGSRVSIFDIFYFFVIGNVTSGKTLTRKLRKQQAEVEAICT